MTKDLKKRFENDGVILVKNAWKNNDLELLKNEYDKLDADLKNQEIFKDEPLIVFWKHVQGEQKRITTFKDFPKMWDFINKKIVPNVKKIFGENCYLQLLETIIFNKPYETSNTLHWHQDVAYFPLKPNNQIAIWFPMEDVDKESGALNYAIGSHKEGIKGSTDLHTRKPFDNEERELIPADPTEAGFEVRCMEMNNTDMLLHNGYTWHYSGPNKKKGYTRKGVSVRFITEPSVFDPRPGQGAAFTKQLSLVAGDPFEGKPFPQIN
tara:strand:- start:1112 stop:1909 length:798 start_codon:yes stop_codon:yes gene_type:complete